MHAMPLPQHPAVRCVCMMVLIPTLIGAAHFGIAESFAQATCFYGSFCQIDIFQ